MFIFDYYLFFILVIYFSEKEPCQRVVTISRCGGWMATGGTDGIVRIWSFPGLRLIRALKAHTKELDDLHFSPDSKQVFFLHRF